MIVERTREATPDGMQHLLHRAKWDVGTVRDDMRGYLAGHLHDPGAVPAVDETGKTRARTSAPGHACYAAVKDPKNTKRARPARGPEDHRRPATSWRRARRAVAVAR